MWRRLQDLLDLADKLDDLHSYAHKLDVYRTSVSHSVPGHGIPKFRFRVDKACHLTIDAYASGSNLHAHKLCVASRGLPHVGTYMLLDDLTSGSTEDPCGVDHEVVGFHDRLD